MLNPSIIKVVSDLDTSIEDYKKGYYSDQEFIEVLNNKNWELNTVLEDLSRTPMQVVESQFKVIMQGIK